MKAEFNIDQIRKFVKFEYGFVSARYVKSCLQHYEELKENKNEIIKAFKAGREAGAIFKKQEDNELLAEQYWIDSQNQTSKIDEKALKAHEK